MDVAHGDPRVIVDLSNVCRDASLGPAPHEAVWSRFRRVMEAWHEQIEQRPNGVAVADENLRFLLAPGDRREFELAERSGLARTVTGAADREILRWAERSGAAVLSRDRFVGHRREHPWIQGAEGRFYAWKADPSGAVRIVPLQMHMAGAYSMSRGEEADLLKERGLDPRRPADRELLAHAYRCANPACLTARFTPDQLLVPPARRQRQPVCPGCLKTLEDLGPRPGAIEIVVEAGERELLRSVVEDGGELVVGRATLPKRRGSDAVDGLGRVSREHLRLRVQGSRLRVCDLGSRNGTAIARWSSATRAFTEAQPITAGDDVEIGHRDIAILGGVLRVRRSGQQFAVGSGDASGRTREPSITTDREDQR